MKKTAFVFLFLFPLMIFLGCQDENDLFRQEMKNQPGDNLTLSGSNSRLIDPAEVDIVYCNEDRTIVEMKAGRQQQFLGGTLELGNDAGDNLYLTLIPADGWAFSEIQIYAGDWDGLPTCTSKRGQKNVKIGEFTESESFDPAITDEPYTFMIPADELVFEEGDMDSDYKSIVIVAHAVIEQTVNDILSQKSLFATWEEDYAFSGPRWGGGFLYEFVSCEEGSSTAAATSGEEVTNGEESSGEAEDTGGETAAIDLTAYSLPDITYSLKIKDLNELLEVGTVTFGFDADRLNLNVTYNVDGSDWFIREIHINIGSIEEVIVGNNENINVGSFTYVKHFDTPYGTEETYLIPVGEYYDPDPGNLCETFTVHATLVNSASEPTVQKSAFVVWNENVDIAGSKWYDSFELCLEPATE